MTMAEDRYEGPPFLTQIGRVTANRHPELADIIRAVEYECEIKLARLRDKTWTEALGVEVAFPEDPIAHVVEHIRLLRDRAEAK
jgi:hypothetical protein